MSGIVGAVAVVALKGSVCTALVVTAGEVATKPSKLWAAGSLGRLERLDVGWRLTTQRYLRLGDIPFDETFDFLAPGRVARFNLGTVWHERSQIQSVEMLNRVIPEISWNTDESPVLSNKMLKVFQSHLKSKVTIAYNQAISLLVLAIYNVVLTLKGHRLLDFALDPPPSPAMETMAYETMLTPLRSSYPTDSRTGFCGSSALPKRKYKLG